MVYIVERLILQTVYALKRGNSSIFRCKIGGFKSRAGYNGARTVYFLGQCNIFIQQMLIAQFGVVIKWLVNLQMNWTSIVTLSRDSHLKVDKSQKQSLFTTSKTDRHLPSQKVCQRISVMKTKTAVFVVFKTKRYTMPMLLKHECVCFHYWDSLTNILA